MKKNSTSSIQHELRSSLAAIESFLNLIYPAPGKSPLSAEVAREYLLRIKSNVRRFSDLIDDLLTHYERIS